MAVFAHALKHLPKRIPNLSPLTHVVGDPAIRRHAPKRFLPGQDIEVTLPPLFLPKAKVIRHICQGY